MDYIGGYSGTGFACTGFGVYAVLGWNTALNAMDIANYLVAGKPDIWGVFAPQLRQYAMGTAVAPTFLGAWARRRSQVIGAGVH